MMTIDAMRAAVTFHLVAAGWTESDGSAVAVKTFDSAVGPKEAFAYFNAWPSEANAALAGDYRSEGSNILENCDVLLPKDSTDEQLGQLVQSFVAGTEHKISESYAVRLPRCGPDEPTSRPRCA